MPLKKSFTYQKIKENIYLTKRVTCKGFKFMKCACSLSESDIIGCREDCINRQLFIECSSKCPCGSNCVNQNFQRCNYAKTTVYQTKDKGAGLRAEESIMKGDFIVEYVGEVIDKQQFGKRKAELKDHLYFMALNSTTFIDAKFKGNESRFINHSCDPNCQIQKWTVNGELRIGIFASKDLRFGEEITCNYHGKNYRQKCFCGSTLCTGWIGEQKKAETADSDDDTQSIDDFQFESDITSLMETGMQNKQQSVLFCRLMVQCKKLDDRFKLLQILKSGEQQSRRLFIDYHGLKLLYNWMMDLNPFDISDLTFCVDLMRTLEELPVPNKTMLSKVLLILEHWSHMDPSENKIKKELQENSEVLPQTELSSCRQLVKATAKALLEKWKDLNEAFKIPKKFAITKDHNEKDPLVELNETKPEPQKERHNRSMNRFLSTKDIQKLEDEKKRNDMQAAHASNCQLFGLDPCTTRPIDTPYHINAISGDFYSIDGRNLPIPPISSKWQQLAANQLKPSEQDPKNYILPKMELPDQSKCSLDNRGKIFEKKRESPIEIRPLDTEEDSSSDTDTEDTEEEELKQQLEFLKSIYKKKMQKIDPQKVNDFKKELEMDEKTNLLVKDLADAGLIPNRKANAEEQPRKKKKHRRQGLTEVRLFQHHRTENGEKNIERRLRRKRKKAADRLFENEDLSAINGIDANPPCKQVVSFEFQENANFLKQHFICEVRCEVAILLVPYWSDFCPNGRITSEADYKYLVNKITYSVLLKEHERCLVQGLALVANESVFKKVASYIEKYMKQFGAIYESNPDNYHDFAKLLEID